MSHPLDNSAPTAPPPRPFDAQSPAASLAAALLSLRPLPAQSQPTALGGTAPCARWASPPPRSRRPLAPPNRRAITRRVDCRGLCRRAPTCSHSRPYRDCSAAHCRQVDVLDPVGSAAPDPLESPRNRIPRLLDPPKPYFSAPPATNSAHSLRHPPTRGRLTRPPRADSPHSNREKCRKWPCESIEVDVAQ